MWCYFSQEDLATNKMAPFSPDWSVCVCVGGGGLFVLAPSAWPWKRFKLRGDNRIMTLPSSCHEPLNDSHSFTKWIKRLDKLFIIHYLFIFLFSQHNHRSLPSRNVGEPSPVCSWSRWEIDLRSLILSSSSSSSYGSTAQFGPWPPLMGFRNNNLYYRAGSSAQPPTWRTRSPYLWPPETGWPSCTSRHWVPILVVFYDMHGLQWDYSLIPVITRGNTMIEGEHWNWSRRNEMESVKWI
jgi:hypothetical protein